MSADVQSQLGVLADRDPFVSAERFEVVIVSYHSRDQVAGLLSGAAGPDQRLVVVDNSSGADGVAGLLAGFPHGRYLDGRNSGFAAAANTGARSSSAEFLIFANPDSRPTPVIWQALLADLEADPHLAAVAASPTGVDGRIEIGAAGWQPTIRRCLVQAVGLHRWRPTAGVYARPRVGASLQPDWLTGACLAVRRKTFLELGGFDERYFVYNEDMAFGRMVRDAGLRQTLRTDLLVPHAAGSSGGGSTKMPQQRGASMAAFLGDHDTAAAAGVMRVVLALGMLARSVAARALGRPELGRRHAAYVRGIVTGRSPYRRGR